MEQTSLPDPESLHLFEDERDPERLSLHVFIREVCKRLHRIIVRGSLTHFATPFLIFFFFTSSFQKLDIFCSVAVAGELLLQAEAPDVDHLLHVGQVLVLIVHPPADGALWDQSRDGRRDKAVTRRAGTASSRKNNNNNNNKKRPSERTQHGTRSCVRGAPCMHACMHARTHACKQAPNFCK